MSITPHLIVGNIIVLRKRDNAIYDVAASLFYNSNNITLTVSARFVDFGLIRYLKLMI